MCLAVQGSLADSVKQIMSAALNLQGMGFLFPLAGIKLHYIGGIGHCWFVTMVMVCYGFTVLLKGSRIERYIDRYMGLSLLLAVPVQILLAMVGIQTSYILQYFIGYFFCRGEKRLENRKPMLFSILTVLMLAVMVLRLVTNRFLDGTVFYDHVIARLSFNVLGI